MRRTQFTTRSPAALADDFSKIARDTASVFGAYDDRQLNWQPDTASWSIAQCFDHLLKTDHEMLQAIGRALDRTVTSTVWQRLPLWPRLLGWMLITSQAPGGRTKFSAPASTHPASSNITPHTIDRFIACQHTLRAGVDALTTDDAQRIMVSPFVSRITYRVLDGYRLIAAHQRRHFEQAARVTQHVGFPRSR